MASDKIRFRKTKEDYQLLKEMKQPFEFPGTDSGGLHPKKMDSSVPDYVDDMIEDKDEYGDDKKSFESIFVIEFHPGVKINAIHWLVDKIRGKKIHGGAELLVMREPLARYSLQSLPVPPIHSFILFLLDPVTA